MSESSVAAAVSEAAIIASLDAAHLLSSGLLRPGQPGHWRLHKRRLNRSSEEEYRDLPINITGSNELPDDLFAMIPTLLVSHETLQYVGLNETTAAKLWADWNNWPSTGPRREVDEDDGGLVVTFLDYILGAFERHRDCTHQDDQECHECLSDLGLDAGTISAILDGKFRYLRMTQPCIYWAIDTIHMRYAGLQDIQRASREREIHLRRATTRLSESKGKQPENPITDPPASETTTSSIP
ncbi:hypothetical protein BR93DRAFT_592969 [Coniochaeta sp. PMI_546]|nr:hypothetical protein BR93DRAFT_592969 [Coniochaeta sp. PMI_546]